MTAPQESQEVQPPLPSEAPEHLTTAAKKTEEQSSASQVGAKGATGAPANGGDQEGALADARRRLSELEAALQRERADFLNYRRRAIQERDEAGHLARISVFRKLLPMLDDLELAHRQTPASGADEPWVEGYRLVARKLMQVLEQAGVTRIGAAGEPFDPHAHEAIGQRPPAHPGERAGTVGEVVRPGYRLDGLILRPAQVIVVADARNHDGEVSGT
jgi:molecular chaperone GrpE